MKRKSGSESGFLTRYLNDTENRKKMTEDANASVIFEKTPDDNKNIKKGMEWLYGMKPKDGNIGKEDKITAVIPGNIYIFRYTPKRKSFTIQTDSFTAPEIQFSDCMPMVLCLEKSAVRVKGINLNYCAESTIAVLLDCIAGFSPETFMGAGCEKYTAVDQKTSNEVSEFLGTENKLAFFKEYLESNGLAGEIEFTPRIYSADKIKRIRIIKPCLWRYVPFVEWADGERAAAIKAIKSHGGPAFV